MNDEGPGSRFLLLIASLLLAGGVGALLGALSVADALQTSIPQVSGAMLSPFVTLGGFSGLCVALWPDLHLFRKCRAGALEAGTMYAGWIASTFGAGVASFLACEVLLIPRLLS